MATRPCSFTCRYIKRYIRRPAINWFKHDTDATQDAKLKKLLIRHGAVGYAIYFHCLELIAAETSETNLTFELEHDSEIIADNLHIQGTAEKSGIEIVEDIMRTIIKLGLFNESNGRVFCFKLLKRLDLSMTSNPKFRELITVAKENHDTVMIPSCKPSSKQANKQEDTMSGSEDATPTPHGKKDEWTEEERGIIDYLNQESGKHFRYTKNNRRGIRERIKEGFTFDDFRLVIDYKANTWGKDKKMSEFVRPLTLFGTKFESYREEVR